MGATGQPCTPWMPPPAECCGGAPSEASTKATSPSTEARSSPRITKAFSAPSTRSTASCCGEPWSPAFPTLPTAAGGFVYTDGYGNNYGEVDARTDSTGRLAWSTSGLQYGEAASPAISGSALYVAYACEQAYSIGLAAGTVLWHHATTCSGGGGRTAAVADGRVFVRDTSIRGFAPVELDPATGAPLATYTSEYIPAIDGSTAFMQTATDGALNAVNLTTGATTWSFAGDGRLNGPPVVVNGIVITQSFSGAVYLLNEASGAVVDSLQLKAAVQVPDESDGVSVSGAAVGNGLYVVADATGTLYAFSN